MKSVLGGAGVTNSTIRLDHRGEPYINSLRAGGLGESYSADALRAVLVEIGIDVGARAESLAPGQLLALARALRSLE